MGDFDYLEPIFRKQQSKKFEIAHCRIVLHLEEKAIKKIEILLF